MREIKFRAWDRMQKQWVQEFLHLSLCNSDLFLCGNNPPEIEKFKNPNSIVLMQFTGLKDKNEKEIYEGDIITLCNFNDRHSDLTLDRKKSIEMNLKKGVVEWIPNNCSFMAVERHLERNIFDQWNNSIALRPSENNDYEIEVIGNIYENPNLIQNQKSEMASSLKTNRNRA